MYLDKLSFVKFWIGWRNFTNQPLRDRVAFPASSWCPSSMAFLSFFLSFKYSLELAGTAHFCLLCSMHYGNYRLQTQLRCDGCLLQESTLRRPTSSSSTLTVTR
jgi:hypothetical protein